MKKNTSSSHILKHTAYIGSTKDKIIHSTQDPCSDAMLIPINSRWYIRTIPHSSGYEKCAKCFKELP